MGQVYSVILDVKFKDKEKAAETLRDKISKGKEENTNYNLDHYKSIGIGIDTIEDLLKIFFGGWRGILGSGTGKDKRLYAGFNACYGWENVMMTAFEQIAPYLEDDSSLTIYPDSGTDKAIVKSGKAIWVK